MCDSRLTNTEVAITEIIHSKAIISLVLEKGVKSADIENALAAVTDALERAQSKLTGVCHA